MIHRFIIVNNCGKYLQNPFKDKKVLDRTWHISSNRQSWPWMSKCYLDLGVRGLIVGHDTSSYYNKHLCQVISDSFDKWQSYGPDMKVWRTDRVLHYVPLFSSKRRGTITVGDCQIILSNNINQIKEGIDKLEIASGKTHIFLHVISVVSPSLVQEITQVVIILCGT
jgi:hypothetical protein